MIRIKFYRGDKEFWDRNNKIVQYDDRDFFRLLGSSEDENEERIPPFRDEASMTFIREVDRGELVENDWYSYVSPYGRTCMSSLCGGTRYALDAIANSRFGLYTLYKDYGSDIWDRLAALDEEILVAYDPNYDDGGVPELPRHINRCVVENFRYSGVEQEAYYDHEERLQDPCLIDGKLHCGYFLGKEYEWDWREHLAEILEIFERDTLLFGPQGDYVFDIPPTVIKDLRDCPLFDEYPCECEEMGVPVLPDVEFHRSLVNHMSVCRRDYQDRYPQGFFIEKKKDGRYAVTDKSITRDPWYWEAVNDVVGFWDSETSVETWTAVIDIGSLYNPEDFEEAKHWYFHDTGTELHLYSGALGARKFYEFFREAMESGKLSRKSD